MKKHTIQHNPILKELISQGEFKLVPRNEIDPSPFNHRKSFPAPTIAELAKSVAQIGIIQNLVVRKVTVDPRPDQTPGRYQLVSGARRLMAAEIANVEMIPVIILSLSDDEVREIQLTENLQREDPTPLEQAEAIDYLLQKYKTIDEVALRLGKSRTFVYSRLRLQNLIPEISRMFLAEKFKLQDVLAIAALPAESQLDFFNTECEDWEEEDFEIDDIIWAIRHYKYDLSNAPFNTKDKSLVAGIGACTKCPSNSATLKTLFPEEADEARCSNISCFNRKSIANLTVSIAASLVTECPVAIIFEHTPSELMLDAIKSIPEATALPQYNRYSIEFVKSPEPPSKQDWIVEFDNGDADALDEEGFAQAVQEFDIDMAEYNTLREEGKILKGLMVSKSQCTPCLFNTEKKKDSISKGTTTAKEVQAALKTGTATPEMLQSEISRIREREARNKQLDQEKTQLAIHQQYTDRIQAITDDQPLADLEWPGVWLLIYQSLDYSAKHEADKFLFPRTLLSVLVEKPTPYQQFANLTPCQIARLLRLAMAEQSDSKLPDTPNGQFLREMAPSIGVDVPAIDQAQQAKAGTREQNQRKRMASLEQKITTLQQNPAA